MYTTILIGDCSFVVLKSTLNKYDVVLFEGSKSDCDKYSDKWNRQLIRNRMNNFGNHKSDNIPQQTNT